MGRTATADKQMTKIEPTMGEQFTAMVIKEAHNLMGGGINLSLYQKQLVQHLFIRIDQALQDAEAKRLKNGEKKTPYVWQNVNLAKLAASAIHRINLGLDALIENHIHPTAYWNSKLSKYDINLTIGYVGKDYYRRKMALDPPVDVIYELVYSGDTFKPIKKNAQNKVESYDFKIDNPWDRGDVVGGFGYIIYENAEKNKLVLVRMKDFEEAERNAPSDAFWEKHREKMQYKTIVICTTKKIPVDPEKINESFMVVEHDDQETVILAQIEENENKEPLDVSSSKQEPEQSQEGTDEKPEQERQKDPASDSVSKPNPSCPF